MSNQEEKMCAALYESIVIQCRHSQAIYYQNLMAGGGINWMEGIDSFSEPIKFTCSLSSLLSLFLSFHPPCVPSPFPLLLIRRPFPYPLFPLSHLTPSTPLFSKRPSKSLPSSPLLSLHLLSRNCVRQF